MIVCGGGVCDASPHSNNNCVGMRAHELAAVINVWSPDPSHGVSIKPKA